MAVKKKKAAKKKAAPKKRKAAKKVAPKKKKASKKKAAPKRNAGKKKKQIKEIREEVMMDCEELESKLIGTEQGLSEAKEIQWSEGKRAETREIYCTTKSQR